jgi:hypothetical protein
VITRRAFCLSSIVAALVPWKRAKAADLANVQPVTDELIKQGFYKPLPPIKIICVGSDKEPATTDIIAILKDKLKDKTFYRKVMNHELTEITAIVPRRYTWQRRTLQIDSNRIAIAGTPYQATFRLRAYTVHRPGPGIFLVRIGSDNRPARHEDIRDAQMSLQKAYDDPDLTIVTHHNFDAKWIPVTQFSPGIGAISLSAPFFVTIHEPTT